MAKFAKKFFIGLGLTIIVLVVSLAIIASFFEQQIGEKLITEINKQIDSELSIKDFELSLLSGFPKASANLKEVNLKGAFEGNLLRAENVAFRFSLFSLFSSNIKVESVVIQNGALSIMLDKKGKGNYNIRKGEEETAESESDFAISIAEAKLENVDLTYYHEGSDMELKGTINEAVMSGQFSQDHFSLNSSATLLSKFIDIENKPFFKDKNLAYDAKIDVDLKNGIYTFDEVSLKIESNEFKVDGQIETHTEYTDLDLEVTSKDARLATMFELLPEKYLSYFEDFESQGIFFFNATIEGPLSDSKTPALDVAFGLDDGKITSDKLAETLKDLSFKATFTNGKENSNKYSIFEIENLKGYFNRELIESSLIVKNLDDPRIDFVFDGVIPLEAVYGLFDSPSITDGDGEIEIKDFELKGRYKDMLSTNRISRVEASGEIEFDDASLKIDRRIFLIDRGRLNLVDNKLSVKNFKFEGPKTEIYFDGSCENLIPVLFADSINSKNAQLSFNAKLRAPAINFDELKRVSTIKFNPKEIKRTDVITETNSENENKESIINFLDGTINLAVEKFNYKKIEGEDFSGQLVFEDNELQMDGKTQAMDGSFDLDGTIFFEKEMHLKAKAICTDVDVKEFFRQFENFGQKAIEHKHVKGTMDSRLSILGYWAEDGTFDSDKLRVYGDIGISNGELLGFKMLYDFSDYIKIEDLKRIKFTKLHNWLEVRRGRLYLPSMFIQSNALNLNVSGVHTFENKIDYNIKINAAQVVFNRFKKHNSSLQPQKAQKNGWFNLYYRITGYADDIKVENDKRGVKARFVRSERMKEEIQRHLASVFGKSAMLNGTRSSSKNEIPEFEEESNPDEIEFIEEFEDQPVGNSPSAQHENDDDDDDLEYIDWEN